MRARKVNLLQPTKLQTVQYPLEFRERAKASYFQQREQWRLTDFLFNPMVCNCSVHVSVCVSVCVCLILGFNIKHCLTASVHVLHGQHSQGKVMLRHVHGAVLINIYSERKQN